ncbi:hypothetical protein E2K80_11900 [Rhodophyticola sp. CCM32]|uniref:hypothetical protein n=1 Tax=Rhodophyticola sp. CCM32 TaxID=2916397 RepID=UPI00107F1B90|nr:hypothetical protein [Rhodophyticola sp. CCM32]QBY01340.1 hypothetical protein E2K80_11900 [Rhodophyticola sp. CCM32]
MSWLFVLPFILSSLVAPGLMPVRTEGGMVIVICSGGDTATIVLGPDGEPVEAEDSRCAWAAHAQSIDMAADDNAVFRKTEFSRLALWQPDVTVPYFGVRPGPPVRGPPQHL